MNLNLPDILHDIKKRQIGILAEDTMPPPRVPVRKHLDKLAAILEGPACQKYIFDSGEDGLNDTNRVVRETAVNMVEAGLFHLPHPVMWIEDPFESVDARNYMLAIEKDAAIRVWSFVETPMGLLGRSNVGALANRGFPEKLVEAAKAVMTDPVQALLYETMLQDVPRYQFVPLVCMIPLDTATDMVEVGWYSEPQVRLRDPDPMLASIATTAIYAVKKLIVTLNARGTERERVAVTPRENRASLPPKLRKYPYTVIRVPTDTDAPLREGQGGGVPGTQPRRQLIGGYTWGKHTRPKDQQRWIEPYWRGVGETVPRDHYEVRGGRVSG